MNLRTAVCIGQAPRPVVVRGRNIAPSSRGESIDEIPVIYRIGMFVDCYKFFRRLRYVIKFKPLLATPPKLPPWGC